MRLPTENECDQLVEVYLRNYAEVEGQPTTAEQLAATKIISQATIVVWDDFKTEDPHHLSSNGKYSGKLMIVVWSDGLDLLDVLIWKDGRMIPTELMSILIPED